MQVKDGVGRIIALGVLLMAALALGLLIARGTSYMTFGLAAIICVVALAYPFAATLLLIAAFMRLKGSEGLDTDEITTFALFAGGAGYAIFSLAGRSFPDKIISTMMRMLVGLLGYIAVSLAISRSHGVSFTAWASDVAPLGCLAMAPIALAVARTRSQSRWLAALLGGLLLVSGLRWATDLVPSFYGLVPSLAQAPSTITPAVLVSWGTAMQLQKRRLTWGYSAMTVIGLAIAVATPTRTIWASLVLTVLVLLWLHSRSTQAIGAAVSALLGIALLTVGTFAAWRYSAGDTQAFETQKDRVSSLGDLTEDMSVTIRQAQIAEALEVFASSPFTGIGPGYMYLSYLEFDRYTQVDNVNHSDLANALAKLGLIGAVMIYGFLFLAVRACMQLHTTGTRASDRALGLMTATTLIIAMVIGNATPLLQNRSAAFFLACLIGVSLASLNLSSQEAAAAQEAEQLAAQ